MHLIVPLDRPWFDLEFKEGKGGGKGREEGGDSQASRLLLLRAQVERTKTRPLASGDVTTKQAWAFLAAQLTTGLGILCTLNPYSCVPHTAGHRVAPARMRTEAWFLAVADSMRV
jgi:hypothetical protein